MKFPKKLIPPLLIVALLIFYFNYEKAKSTPDPNRIRTSGYIEAHSVQLGSLNGGRVISMAVSEGETVIKGQMVAEFETDRLEFRKKETEAAIESARSQYEKLATGPRGEEIAGALEVYLASQARVRRLKDGFRDEDIAPLYSKLNGAEASLEKAELDQNRMQDLFDADVVSRTELESAAVAVDIAKSGRDAISDEITRMELGFTDEEINSARHEAGALRENLLTLEEGTREEDLRSAGFEIERLQAVLEGIDDEIDEARVIAPVEGTIRELTVRTGDIVPPGAPVAVLVESEPLWVQVYIPAHRLPMITIGQTAYITPDSFEGKSIEANVSYISPEGEFTPRNIQTTDERVQRVFAIRLTITDSDERLKPGMGCEVEIPIGG